MKREFKKGEEIFAWNYLEPDLNGFGIVLEDKVVEGIKNNGYYGFYWGRHTSKDMREFGNDSIHIVMDWIREEGFRIEKEISVYGVPNYYASL